MCIIYDKQLNNQQKKIYKWESFRIDVIFIRYKKAMYFSTPLLTYCGYIGTLIWVNIGSASGLLSDSTKPLTDPILTNLQRGLVVFT